jgi:hypothetical protein
VSFAGKSRVGDLILTVILRHIRSSPAFFPAFFHHTVLTGAKFADNPPFSGVTMKKPKIEMDEPQPRKIIRADKAPTEGYSLVVDGHFKSHHDTVEAAEEAGMALKNKYQMLQVQVYDSSTKTRTMIEWPAPAA